jgi:uncharacterized protein (DUF2336 family)
MIPQASLIDELEDAIRSGSDRTRVDTLRKITDLFLADADRLNEQQIEVFDSVLGHLIKRIEDKALVELSQRLSPVDNAPVEVVRRLARSDEIAVAAPVLTQSRRLADQDLIEIASNKSQNHLLAIAERSQITEGVTDVLLRRGDRNVFHKLAENTGATFSDRGFSILAEHSAHDEALAEKFGLRIDIPFKLFRELLQRATEAVRSRLMAAADAANREKIQQILTDISIQAQSEVDSQNKRDFAKAHVRMLDLKDKGVLNQATIVHLAKTDQHTDIVAALSILSGAPLPLLETLLQSDHREAWLISCKVAEFDWQTVLAILNCRSLHGAVPEQTIEAARADYIKLSKAGAGRILRFWQVRQTAAKDTESPSQRLPRLQALK